jgi:16S rRNA processing protein RimM
MRDARILVGRITAAHGIRGEVKVKSFTAEPAALCAYSPLFGSDGRAFGLRLKSRGVGDTIIAGIDGVSDRNAAEALKGTGLWADRARLAPDGGALLSDLPGLRVLGADGVEIGVVKDTLDYGAGDILEIALAGRSGTALMLLSADGVLEIDKDKGFIKIDCDHLLES